MGRTYTSRSKLYCCAAEEKKLSHGHKSITRVDIRSSVNELHATYIYIHQRGFGSLDHAKILFLLFRESSSKWPVDFLSRGQMSARARAALPQERQHTHITASSSSFVGCGRVSIAVAYYTAVRLQKIHTLVYYFIFILLYPRSAHSIYTYYMCTSHSLIAISAQSALLLRHSPHNFPLACDIPTVICAHASSFTARCRSLGDDEERASRLSFHLSRALAVYIYIV